MWSHIEELQSRMAIIQTLENRLAALSQQHEAEMKNTQQVINICTPLHTRKSKYHTQKQ